MILAIRGIGDTIYKTKIVYKNLKYIEREIIKKQYIIMSIE